MCEDGKQFYIVLPVYNVLRYLPDCQNSLDAQTCQNFTIIAVDDGSSDESGAYLDAWAKVDKRVLVLHKENGGLASARNAALDYLLTNGVAQQEDSYLLFLDSDDMLEPRSVEQVWKRMQEDNLDILEFEGRPIFETTKLEAQNEGLAEWLRMHGDYSQTATGPEYLARSGVADQKSCTWLRAYRTKYLFETKLRFPEGLLHEDVYFAFASVLLAKRVACLHEILYVYRIRQGSITTLNHDWANIKGRFLAELQMLRELEKHPELTQEQTNVAQGIIEECIVSNYEDYRKCNPVLIKEKVEKELLPGDQMLFYKLLIPERERKN